MAIAQTGSTLQIGSTTTANTGTVSTTVTVPADAEIVVVALSAFGGTNYFSGGNLKFTKGGSQVNMTMVAGGDSAGTWQAAMGYLALPDTGANKTLSYDWAGAGTSADNERNYSITFWKGIDTASPVRDSDGAQSGSFPVTTPTLTAQTGDLIVAFCAGFNGAANGSGTVNTWSNLTELVEVTHQGYSEGAWATGSPSGNTTVGASTGSNWSEPAIVAAVLKAAATGVTGTLAATEAEDVAALAGTVRWHAVLAATEAADVAALVGLVGRSGTLAATEATDTASLAGTVVWTARLAAWEADQYELLLHLDGADGATAIVDSGGGSHTVTAHGAAQIDTSQSVFDGQALMVSSNSDYLMADTGDYAFGTDDFCIDFRVRVSSASAPQMFYDGGANGPQIFYDGSALQYSSAAGTISGSALSADTNYHIAATRGAGSTRLWKNGVQEGSTLADTTSYGASGGYPRIGGSGLPSGVTLQAIDGGSNYYASNGFTFAETAGWDDPSFFPICLFLERIDDQDNFDTWIDLGLNTALGQQANSPALLLMRANPGQVWAIPQSSELTTILANNGGVLGAETVGLHAADEPTTLTGAYQYLESTANSVQDHRFWQLTFLHTAMDFGDVEGTEIPDVVASLRTTPNATQRRLDLSTTDSYFCAGAHYLALREQYSGKFHLGANWSEPEMTEAQARRPCHYGDYVRFMRLGNPNIPIDSWFREIGSFPIGTWIETCAPYTENTDAAYVMKPTEINAAVWSTIINGARMILYFSLGEGSVGDSLISGTFWQTPLSGETISNYDQIAATDALVQSLASVINSPFAVGYVSVSPAAQYLDHTHDDAGFDVMAKYHNVEGGDNKFYIVAMPRVAATPSQSATFTIANTGATQVTVINESRTISVTGGTTFSDTFATGNTVHIYRVD